MSRLYSTLEKIRAGEEGGLAPAPDARSDRRWSFAGAKKNLAPAKLFLLPAIFLLLFGGWYFAPQMKKLGSFLPGVFFAKQSRSPAVPEADRPAAPAASSSSLDRDAASAGGGRVGEDAPFLALNEAGCALFEENRHWQAIRQFDLARQLEPKRPEPLINMAVALAELGLTVPARRLLKEAAELASDHPALLRNLAILGSDEE